jgi:hypothetical protein
MDGRALGGPSGPQAIRIIPIWAGGACGALSPTLFTRSKPSTSLGVAGTIEENPKPTDAMKQHTHCLLSEWACTARDMILRTIWLALFVAAIIGVLRLMAWADTGMHGDQPVEKRILP